MTIALLCGIACIAQPPPSAFAGFDRMLHTFLEEHQTPGAAVAVGRNGRVVFSRGYGLADVESRTPVQPDSLFRIASISKPITAVAVLQLVERDKLDLDASILDVLRRSAPFTDVDPVDPRWRSVTIEQLLQHSGGWDRDAAYDPMFRACEMARHFGLDHPPTPTHVVQYMLGQPLQCDPGTQYAYSNFGYCLLGRAIEIVSEQSYEQYVKLQVLAPLGIERMRLGRTRRSERADGEVTYHTPRASNKPSVLDGSPGPPVPAPYGGWNLEAMDAHGGWLASAEDLVRFAASLDDPANCPVLSAASIEQMFARPAPPLWHNDGKPTAHYYACGWLVRPMSDHPPGHRNTWHAGALDGTSTLLVRRHDGVSWAALFNTRRTADGRSPASVIDPLMHRAANEVEDWPE